MKEIQTGEGDKRTEIGEKGRETGDGEKIER